MYVYLAELKKLGFVVVQNSPIVGVIDGHFRQHLEETGMGYHWEVEMIQIADWHGLITTAYVFSSKDAIQMAKAGAEIVVAHAGLITSGSWFDGSED
jgi:predicted TIM-barrel enzyme